MRNSWQLADFDYDLPVERIAQSPVEPRDAARLLISRREGVAEGWFHDLGDLLQAGDCLVVNDTRVIPARLLGRKPGGGRAELLLLRPTADERVWEALVGSNKGIKPGLLITVADDLQVLVIERQDSHFIVRIISEAPVATMLQHHGEMPLPPYITGRDPARDRGRYQTVYARETGAVAAPTAGLHFTEALLTTLQQQGILLVPVTLHVGLGTFQPVRVEDLSQHHMHREWGVVPESSARTINQVRAAGGRVVAVGTTVVRVLESAADPDGVIAPFAGETELFILPGYRFRAVDRLITNFHLPKSTLRMLVAAFVGKARMDRDYDHAMAQGFRFFSYGDACFLYPA